MAGLEPAFAGRAAWPPAGVAMRREPDDPVLPMQLGHLVPGLLDSPDSIALTRPASGLALAASGPLAPRSEALPHRSKWRGAVLASCLFHAAVALAFIGLGGASDEVLIEGITSDGEAMLGNAADDQLMSGEAEALPDTVSVTMIAMVEAKPVETVEAEPVPAETGTAETETLAAEAPSETLRPVEAETVMAEAAKEPKPNAVPAETSAVVPAEPLAETVPAEPLAPARSEITPEVLAAETLRPVEDDNIVAPQAAPAAERVETETVQPAESEAVEADKSEAVREIAEAASPVEEVKPEAPKPDKAAAERRESERKAAQKLAAEKKVADKKAAEKKAAAKKSAEKKAEQQAAKLAEKREKPAARAGNGGNGSANARKGQAEGSAQGNSGVKSRGGSGNGEVGNAAVSNYPGKVYSKLARASRSMRAGARGEAVVAFAVAANGGVRSARIARSSGIASVDSAALQAVRKASPYPPIPANAGRSSWDFNIPVAFNR